VRRAGLLLFLALVLAGCGGKTATTGASPTATAGSETCASFDGGTARQTSSTKPSETMFLSALHVDAEACGDRIIFDFERANGARPGYSIDYRPAAEAQTEDASGNHIPIAGKAFLVVRFEPAATADTSGGTLDRKYTGPRTIVPAGMHWVRQVSKTGDFEAVLTWAIGLSEKRAVKVTSAPSRLTIELG
jgi:hypothetical protein